MMSIAGAAYVGAWRDGADAPSSCADCVANAQSAVVAGARLKVSLDAFPVPFSIWGGVSRWMVFLHYVDGTGESRLAGSDRSEATQAFEVGARLMLPATTHVWLGAEAQRYLAMPHTDDDPDAVVKRFGIVVMVRR